MVYRAGEGNMRGFDGFFPLKMSSFKDTENYLPKGQNELIVQNLLADRLVEGREYIMWFACDSGSTEPVDASVALGYKVDNRNFHRWQDLTGIVKFLGLTPNGPKINDKDEFRRSPAAK
jgi:hypothetical protein